MTQPSASTGTTSASTTSTQGGATHEAILNMMTSGIAHQALAKVGAKGKGKGDSGGKGAPVTLQKCSRCKGMHLPKLALESCPNKVSLEAGTLKDTLSEGKKCTYWVQREPDGSKKECGGEGHTWEDHRAAVVKAHGGVGNTGKGKGGKGKAKGKAKGTKEAIVELKEEDFATVLAAKLSAEYVATLVETDSADTTGPTDAEEMTEQDLVNTIINEAASSGDVEPGVDIGDIEQAVDSGDIEPAVNHGDDQQAGESVMIMQEANRVASRPVEDQE